MSYVTVLGEDSWILAPDFLYTPPHVPSSFADVVLYPFTVINFSWIQPYVGYPESFQQIIKPEDGLRDPEHIQELVLFSFFFLFKS